MNILASRLSIENERLKIGQVKRVTSNNGNTIDSIELLLNNNAKVLFVQKGNTVDFSISNPLIDMSNFDGIISSDVLRDFAIAIKDMYNQTISNERNEVNEN